MTRAGEDVIAEGYDPTCFGCFWSSEITSVESHAEVAVPCARHEPRETPDAV